jgi:hypothetical protein
LNDLFRRGDGSGEAGDEQSELGPAGLFREHAHHREDGDAWSDKSDPVFRINMVEALPGSRARLAPSTGVSVRPVVALKRPFLVRPSCSVKSFIEKSISMKSPIS